MKPEYRTLPIRRWLALALVVVFFVPVIVTGFVAATQVQGPWHARFNAVQTLQEDASRWNDPSWRSAMKARFASQGVDFVLFENGKKIYSTTPNPLAGTNEREQRAVQEVVIQGSQPLKTAYIYTNQGPPGRVWLMPLAGLSTLLLTLAAIGWLLGRTVIRPLAATSRAARDIASGDMEVELPRSRVREVAELNSAFTDMSAELRASLQHQAELEEERRFFIGAIAHDLRTPLFSLRGYLDGLEQGLANTPEKAARYVRVCHEKADALERLVSDLFAYTKAEYLEQTVRHEPLDLRVVLNRATESLRSRAEAKGISLRLNGSDQACALEGDEHLLERAVSNLLDNALRYTPEGGRIDLSWRAESDRAIFKVADTGPGIPAEDLPHLFDPLYTGDPSRNPETSGTGLGLTIARRILRAHGGDLVAANRPTGGAEFTGRLPHTSDISTENQARERARQLR